MIHVWSIHGKVLVQWIHDLSDPVFAVRDRAMKQLAAIAEEAELSLAHALATTPDLEKRRRLELLLRTLEDDELAKRAVQIRRVLAVLEYAGVKEARTALKRFARAAPYDPATPSVQAILKRWPAARD
jgi:hypothetical protein